MLTTAWLSCWLLLAAPPASDFPPLPNPEFREGDKTPIGWTLSGGQGNWVSREILEVVGDGKGSNEWRCDYRFVPGRLYRFEVRARRTAGSGGIMVGPSFANHDFQVDGEWKWYSYVFRTLDRVDGGYLRVGQWQAAGTLQFDAVRLVPVLPVNRMIGEVVLGEGETIRSGHYTFSGTLGGEGTNCHRSLLSATASFNSDRWCFAAGSQVVYRFALPGCKFRSASASFNVNYGAQADCIAEVSRDGRDWRPLARQKGIGPAQAVLPADLLPAEMIYLRLSAAPLSYFQVNQVELQADLAGPRTDAVGQTVFADLQNTGRDLIFDQLALRSSPSGGAPLAVRLVARNQGDRALRSSVTVRVLREATAKSVFQPADGAGIGVIAPRSAAAFEFPLPQCDAGRSEIEIALQSARGGEAGSAQAAVVQFAEGIAHLKISLPEYYRTDYGRQIEGVEGKTAVWWCDATHKIAPQRATPQVKSPAAELSAARNDREAVQIVVRPTEPLKGLMATASPLRQVGNPPHVISAENTRIARVAYHFVQNPTDKTGVADWWPDALPPLTKPIDLLAGKNQPLWVLVHVPKDAKPGDYTGEMTLKAEGWSATVPLKLHVWNFALPERNHVETALGLEPQTLFRYHQAKSEADKRRVLDMYLESFAEHRISPYDPVPLDPIGVEFVADTKPPRTELDFSHFDPAMERALKKYHFSNFAIHLQAMGGGTFHERFEPSIGSFKENTTEYQAMFSSYVKQIEDHLRAKGWLNMAYTYWFDEPDVKDYAFVRAGMERIKRYAPGIQNMITKQPEDAMAGPIDIWCPVTPNYNHAAAQARRAKGERLWWYVCCSPKEPYCTLFIDHPATEMRVWLWQSWQRQVSGVLIWSTNYWTSDTAFPDKPQDPYEDPMGYVSGYGTPKGAKQFWGNGDGRFLYPPESAAVPGASGPAAVFDPPVSSIRWEILREGIEDYEFLYLLRERLAKRRTALKPEEVQQYEGLLEVPAEITRGMTTFTADPSPIYARRAAIAAAIERLGE